MRIGAVLPVDGGSIAESARAAERAGFESVWVVEAYNRGVLIADPLIALALAAATTEHIELGTAIVQAPLRPPYLLATQVATLAAAAPGRFTLGVGAGASPQDYAACGIDFTRRFDLLDRHVTAMRSLLGGGVVGGNRLGRGEPVGQVPVLVGAWRGSHWTRRAAIEFDGWIASAHSTTVEEMAAGLERFRDASELPKRAVAANLDGERSDTADVVAALAAAGFDDVAIRIDLGAPDLGERLAEIRSSSAHRPEQG